MRRYERAAIRAALALLPSDFREEFGPTIARVAGDRLATTVSAPARLIVLARISADILRQAVLARRDRWGNHRRVRASGGRPMVGHDIRFAFRTLGRRPGFLLVTLVTLAVGIGGNTAMFAVVNTVLLTPLPYPAPEELVMIWSRQADGRLSGVSLHDYEDWRARQRVFASLGVFVVQSATVSGSVEPERAPFALVSPSLLRTLGVQPAIGRWFHDDENLPGQNLVVIVSHGFWQTRLGGDPDVLGRSIDVDGRPHAVVGVMPATFTFPSQSVRFWRPFGMRPEDGGSRGGRWVRGVARLRARTTPETASADMARVSAELAAEYPDTNRGFSSEVVPLLEAQVGGSRETLMLLWGAVGLVWLVAAANVANLQLARMADRERRELPVRRALGASRLRLASQLLIEHAIIVGAGLMAGLVLAVWLVSVLPGLTGFHVPRLSGLAVDGSAVVFAVVLSLITAAVIAIGPVLRGVRLGGVAGDGSGGRWTTAPHDRVRWTLVVVEVAVSVVVLIGAGLLLRTLDQVLAHAPGFDADRVVSAHVEPAWRVSLAGLPREQALEQLDADRDRATIVYDTLLTRLRQLPGVTLASAVNAGPLTGNRWATRVLVDGESYATPNDHPLAFYRVVWDGYFETLNVPIVEGRALAPGDRAGAPLVAVVNQAFVRAHLPDGAVGRRIRLDEDAPWLAVVGVSGDMPTVSLEADRPPMIHVPFPQAHWGFSGNWGMDVLVQTDGDPVAVATALRDIARDVDRTMPVDTASSLTDIVSGSTAARQFNAMLLVVFGAMAGVLAMVGLYGVLAFSVAERRREIGVRAALGATRADIVGSVLGRGFRLTAVGLLTGLPIAYAATRYVESHLYGVTPADPLTFGAVALVVLVAALPACVLPSARAARVDPVIALRAD